MSGTPRNAADIAKGVAPKRSSSKAATKKAPAKKVPAKKPAPKVLGPTDEDEAVELANALTIDPDNPKHARLARFIDEYMIDLNGTQAAIRAHYSVRTAQVQASRLLSNVMVQAEISRRQHERRERLGIEADTVYKYVHGIATVDTNELIENRIDACRYCWGRDNRYQFTRSEMEAREEEYNTECAAAADNGEEMPQFDEKGGTGFNPKEGPNPECMECFGDGVPKIVMKDSRNMSPQARMAYGGTKPGKFGPEMVVYERTKALDMLARHEGFYNDKLDLNMGQQMTAEELDALYEAAEAKAMADKETLAEREALLGDLEP
ncbi:terminase small subunit [Pseudomonas sp.]|jgi:hypothetical protein|uniref:terminase small subunit n=1 Tax=Pseudomonas sp. TaxID=306 RepID=UPI002EDB5343